MFSCFLTVEFSTYDILKIIRYLNPNKAHGHNIISIRMLKIWDKSICKPLGIISWSCLQNGKFPSEWKKANVGGFCFQKKKKRNKYRTIAPFLYCLFQAKYLKGYYMTVCLLFFLKKTKKLYGPFLWMGFNYLKARAIPRRQFAFYH